MLMRLTGKESERALCFTSQDVVVPCMLGWCCLVEAIRESTRECQLGLLPNAEGPLVMRVLPSLGGPQCEIPYKGFASPNKSVIVVLRGLVITELATITKGYGSNPMPRHGTCKNTAGARSCTKRGQDPFSPV